jgi:hypothetical protein
MMLRTGMLISGKMFLGVWNNEAAPAMRMPRSEDDESVRTPESEFDDPHRCL